jgi:hypothetical protein
MSQEGQPVITIKKDLGTVRDRSLRWLWNAYNVVNNVKLVKQVNKLTISTPSELTPTPPGIRKLQGPQMGSLI